MKNKRIAASFDQVSLPADREDALLGRILCEADAARAAVKKEEDNMYTEKQIHHIQPRGKSPEAEKRGGKAKAGKWRALRVLVPVAAIVLVLVTLFSIPAVSKALSGWFNDFFRVQRYMEGRNENEVDPDMEQAIQSIDSAEQSYEIALLSEIPATEHYSFEDIDKLRAEAGQPAFSESDWAWLREIEPSVTDVLYDGKNLIVRLFYKTDPVPFTRGYLCGIEEGELALDILCFGCSVKVDGKDVPIGGCAHGLDFSKWYDKREAPGFSIEDVREDGGVYAEVIIDFPASPGLPDGVAEAEFVMSVQDAQVDDMGIGGVVALITHRFRFDTAEGNAQIASHALDALAFTGEALVTVNHYGVPIENPDENDETRAYDARGNRVDVSGEAWIENRLVPLAGFTVTPVVNVRSTGVHVTLPYEYPESWDYDTQNAVMDGIVYELIVDGVSQGMLFSSGTLEAPTFEISLTPTELAEVESIVLRPYARHLSMRGDVPMVTGVRIKLSESGEGLVSFDYEDAPLAGCDIAIAIPRD